MKNLTKEELSYSSNTASIYEGSQYALPVLTNTHNLSLTFSSSDTNVATINSTGVVSIVGNGTTTISAAFSGNSEYNAKTISYVLTIDIKKYLDYKGLETFKLKLDEIHTAINNSIIGLGNRINELLIINVQSISTNINAECHITGSSNSGKIEYILYTNSSGTDKVITVPTTYKTPTGSNIILTCKPLGYCEISFINANGTIYARGL